MLQIRKKLENVFKHFDTERGNFMLSQGYFKLDNGVFQIVEEGGAERHTYSLSDITIYDDTAGGIAENYTTDVALYARLVELRYNLLDLNGLSPTTPNTYFLESPLDLKFTGSNSFELPENYILLSVFLNIALQKYAKYLRTPSGIIVLESLEDGDVVNVRGFVASGTITGITVPIPSLEMVTSQGSRTLVTIQSPDAVNSDDLVNLGQVETLIGDIVIPNPSFEDVLGVDRVSTISPIIPDSTEPNGAVNLRQVEEMISEIPTPILFTTDASLYLDPITNELRANTGLSTENFEYASGVQEFTLVDEPSFVFSLMLNLVSINNPLTDYSIEGKKLTILKPIEPTDKINITYQFIITT